MRELASRNVNGRNDPQAEMRRAGGRPTRAAIQSCGGAKTGLGDLNVFAARLFDTGDPAISFGVGPQITVPTATEDEVGSEK